ncbi:hypothetical protein PGT21_003596 [Puccinia graminis f. sp. tritici]|uniref:Uncharacterized protein n=1 Tax=Puccinia graminis f. sp. tritici TaxID=56615 RepID=A0A5B0LXM3_PUCGR|nr:hypothetical protein PGT21_003596 [Puccinia graminis f. sp. tritici]
MIQIRQSTLDSQMNPEETKLISWKFTLENGSLELEISVRPYPETPFARTQQSTFPPLS